MAAKEGQVIACHSVDEWNLQFDKAKDSGKLVVVDFTASWCGPCRFISPILADLAKKWTDIIFLKVDIDEVEPVAKEYAFDAVPTFIFIKEGKVINKIVGARKEALVQAVIDNAPASVATANA